MAHKPTPSSKAKVSVMLTDKVPMKKIASEIGVSLNTFKKAYSEELAELKGVHKVVAVAIKKGMPKEEVEEAINPLKRSIERRYAIETDPFYSEMGKKSIAALYKRVKNGVKETTIAYEVTEWDEEGNPIEQKILGYTEKTKACPTKDVQLLISLTTNGMSFKDEEMIRAYKERHEIRIEEPPVVEEKPDEIDYSKLSIEELKELKAIMNKARVNE